MEKEVLTIILQKVREDKMTVDEATILIKAIVQQPTTKSNDIQITYPTIPTIPTVYPNQPYDKLGPIYSGVTTSKTY